MNGEIGVHEINEQSEKLDSLLKQSETEPHLTRSRRLYVELAIHGIKVMALCLIYIGQSIGRLVDEQRNHRP